MVHLYHCRWPWSKFPQRFMDREYHPRIITNIMFWLISVHDIPPPYLGTKSNKQVLFQTNFFNVIILGTFDKQKAKKVKGMTLLASYWSYSHVELWLFDWIPQDLLLAEQVPGQPKVFSPPQRFPGNDWKTEARAVVWFRKFKSCQNHLQLHQ